MGYSGFHLNRIMLLATPKEFPSCRIVADWLTTPSLIPTMTHGTFPNCTAVPLLRDYAPNSLPIPDLTVRAGQGVFANPASATIEACAPEDCSHWCWPDVCVRRIAYRWSGLRLPHF
jgi:hypothetical protein